MSRWADSKGSENIIEALDVNPRIISCAKRVGFVTAAHLLQRSEGELQQRMGLSAADVDQLLNAVTSHILTKPVTAWQMAQNIDKNEVSHITTGCSDLDELLGGGVPACGITEVSGESGSAKTQFMLQLALNAQLSRECGGLEKGVAYICTESQFPVIRLQQLIEHMRIRYPKGPKSYTDRILIHHIPDMDSLVDCIRYQLPILLSKQQVGLIVIDSVAAAFRAEDGTEVNKTIPLQTLGYRLHQLATTHKVAVIAVNQVAACIENKNLYGIMGDVTPALGLAWSNLLTTRLLLRRTNQTVRGLQALPGSSGSSKIAVEYRLRKLEVVFCPWLERNSALFTVTEKGIESVQTAH